MCIFICGRGLPTLDSPRYGVFEFDQALALSKFSSEKIIYISLDARSFRRKRKWGLTIEEINGNLIAYNFSIPIGNIPKILFSKIYGNILKVFFSYVLKKEGKPLLVHTHFYDISKYYMFVKDEYQIPLVITEHYSGMNKQVIEEKLKLDAEILYKKADVVIAVGEELSNNLDLNFGINSIVVGNVLNEDIFSFFSNSSNNKKNRIISVGNLTKNKNMAMLIQVYSKLINEEKYKDYELIIIGQGEEYEKLTEQIEQWKLRGKVLLLGQKNRDEIQEYLKESKIFALLSSTETFGVAYIEALSMGLPVLATNCGSTSLFINNKNGIVINENDPNEALEALKYLIDNFHNYNSNLISENIRSLYGEREIAKRLFEQYELIKKSKRTSK